MTEFRFLGPGLFKKAEQLFVGFPFTKILHNHCFQLLLGITVVLIVKFKTMLMQFFWGGEGKRGVFGQCENGE